MLPHLLSAQAIFTSSAAAPANGQLLPLAVLQQYCFDSEKSAIAQLQELCVKLKMIVPLYVDEAKSGADHQPMFFVKCVCNTEEKRGKGPTKKIAKENAANQMIAALTGRPQSTPTIAMPLSANAIVNNIEQVVAAAQSHNGDGAAINARGRLHELCTDRKVKPPEFSDAVTLVDGNFSVTCRVQKYMKTGTGKTKKAAIQDGALQMLDMLEYRFETEINFAIKCEEMDFPAPEDIIKVYRKHKKLTKTFDGEVMLNDRHDYFQRLTDVVRCNVRRIIDSNNVAAARKVEQIVNVLGRRYEIGAAKCGSAMRMFVMDGDYDVVVIDTDYELCQTVVNYFKDMIR